MWLLQALAFCRALYSGWWGGRPGLEEGMVLVDGMRCNLPGGGGSTGTKVLRLEMHPMGSGGNSSQLNKRQYLQQQLLAWGRGVAALKV